LLPIIPANFRFGSAHDSLPEEAFPECASRRTNDLYGAIGQHGQRSPDRRFATVHR